MLGPIKSFSNCLVCEEMKICSYNSSSRCRCPLSWSCRCPFSSANVSNQVVDLFSLLQFTLFISSIRNSIPSILTCHEDNQGPLWYLPLSTTRLNLCCSKTKVIRSSMWSIVFVNGVYFTMRHLSEANEYHLLQNLAILTFSVRHSGPVVATHISILLMVVLERSVRGQLFKCGRDRWLF